MQVGGAGPDKVRAATCERMNWKIQRASTESLVLSESRAELNYVAIYGSTGALHPQQLHHIGIAPAGRRIQRRFTVVVPGLDVCAHV